MAYPQLATSTPYRDANPMTNRFPIQPAGANAEQFTLLRSQDAGSGFSVCVRHLGKKNPFTFSIKQSNDAGQTDAYAAMTLRLGATTVTSVTLQPGGEAEVSIDYNSAQKPYVGFFTDAIDAYGYADFIFDNGSFDHTSKPALAPITDNEQYVPLDSGVISLLAASFTPVLEWHTYDTPVGAHQISLTGVVAVQNLAHLQLELQSQPNAPWAVAYTDTAFNTSGGVISSPTTNNPHTTASGTNFLMTLNADGWTGFRLSAKSASDGGTLRLVGAAN